MISIRWASRAALLVWVSAICGCGGGGGSSQVVTPPAPTLTSIDVASGPQGGGTPIALTGTGFAIVEEHRWNAGKGLSDEVPLLGAYLGDFLYGPALARWIKRRARLNRWFGHKILFVCRKAEDAAR